MSKAYWVDFRVPETVGQLVEYISGRDGLFNQSLIADVIDSNDRRLFYTERRIPKRSKRRIGSYRVVWECKDQFLAEAHKSLARRFDLFARYVDLNFPHEAAYGFVRRRGTRDNAEVHCGARVLLRADIRDFFPSISLDRLASRFAGLGVKRTISQALARFVTVDDRLPLGLHASPMLANLICVSLDQKIQNLAAAHKCKYTRYADDIAISGNEVPTKAELNNIIRDEGFEIASEKFRITKPGQAHYVTGLSISDPLRPHVPRMMKRRLRQELYYCNKFGVSDHLTWIGEAKERRGVNRIAGTVRYVSYIETSISRQLKDQWNAVLQRDGLEVSYEPLANRPPSTVTCLVDECQFSFAGKTVLALALVFTDQLSAISVKTLATLREHLSDPFYAGNRLALEKNGLHFVDSHPDLRTAYIKAVAALPFRAFIVFATIPNKSAYASTYVSLLSHALPRRLMWYDQCHLQIVAENNPNVNAVAFEAVVRETYQRLTSTNNRRPLAEPTVSICTKSQIPAFALPDYLLAVFHRYAELNEHPKEPIREHQFERLRDKFRLIIDADNEIEFSRRRPFAPWPTAVK